MELKEIIMQINLMTETNELNSLTTIIRDRIKSLVKSEITVGCEVYVVQKTKRTLGTVTKINRTKAVVDMVGKGSYRVPLTMLEVV